MSPLLADIVAKVENRTARRISLKSILRRACCRKALRRQYEGRWSFWYETMWSLHVATRETHQRSLKFSYFTRKRLLQQYRHFSDMAGSADDVCCWGKSGSHILGA